MTKRLQGATRSADTQIDVAPSKYMRLGSGLSSIAKSPMMSCFDVELFAEKDISDHNSMSESDLLELFGISNQEEKLCSKSVPSTSNSKSTT